jgi:hypothetical protein
VAGGQVADQLDDLAIIGGSPITLTATSFPETGPINLIPCGWW